MLADIASKRLFKGFVTMIDLSAEVQRAVAAVNGATRIGLACHVNPDGDALGSSLAMYQLLRDSGKDVVVTWPEPFQATELYRFLPAREEATKPSDVPDCDVVVTFDCGSFGRLMELVPWAQRAKDVIVVDHHLSNNHYGTINIIDPVAASTTMVVRGLLDAFGMSLTRDVAICLFTGLVADTGRFQYSNTTTAVFRLAAELSEYDLPIDLISRKLFEEHSFAYLQLAAHCLQKAKLDEELSFVHTTISDAELEQFGAKLEETEGLIDLLRRTAEAEVSCVLKLQGPKVSGSLRSLSKVDVSAIAARFGGGGHRLASGFNVTSDPDTVLAEIKEALRSLSH